MWKRTEDMSFLDFMNANYATFDDAIKILKTLNGLLPEVVAKYKRSSLEEWINKFRNLSEDAKQ
jgi:hypothetical protein